MHLVLRSSSDRMFILVLDHDFVASIVALLWREPCCRGELPIAKRVGRTSRRLEHMDFENTRVLLYYTYELT